MRFFRSVLPTAFALLAVSSAFADPRIDGAPSRPNDNFFGLAGLQSGARCNAQMTYEQLRTTPGAREFRVGGESFYSLRQSVQRGDPHYANVSAYRLEMIYIGKRHLGKTPAQVMEVYSRFDQHAQHLANNSFITASRSTRTPSGSFRVRYTQRGIAGITNGDAIYDVEDRITQEGTGSSSSYVLNATGVGSNANVFAPIWSSGTFRADPTVGQASGTDVVACNYMIPRLTTWNCTIRAVGPCVLYNYDYIPNLDIMQLLTEYRAQVYTRVRQTAEHLIRWVDSDAAAPAAATTALESRLAH